MKKESEIKSLSSLPNLRNDKVFKAIFTQNTVESKIALTSFLEAAIGRSISEAEVSVDANEPATEHENQRSVSFDVHVIFTDGTVAEIEMEGFEHPYDFGKRAEYNAARLLATHFSRGQDWNTVPAVYQISVLNFHYTGKKKKAIHRFSMYDPSDSQSLSDTLNIIFLELPKLPRPEKCDINILKEIEKWGIFLKYGDKNKYQSFMSRLAESSEGVKMAQATAFRMSEEQRRLFRQISIEKAEHDYVTDMNYARKQGEKKGLQQGIAQGEHNARIETARALFALGVVTVEQIAQATGLSLAEVEQLQTQTVKA